jgi:hypothetical protein
MPKICAPEHPLASACLKLKRANVHIRGLNAAIRRASRDPDIALTRRGKLNLQSNIPNVIFEGVGTYEMAIDPSVDPTWGLIVGDILNNLRASLDHIAWALATKHAADRSITLTEGQEKSVYFPLRIAPANKPVLGGLAQGDVGLFPPKARNLVEDFQPYNRTKRPELNLLGVLGELANQDKHRLVTPVRREVGFRLTDSGQFMRTRLDKPDSFLFAVPDSMRHNLKPEATFDVVLYVPLLWPSWFSVSDFRLIHSLVRDKVIPAFAVCFS